MFEIPDDLLAKAELLRALSRDGGPLSPDAPRATWRNPQWFQQSASGGLQPTPQRLQLHRKLLAQFSEEHGRGDVGHQAIMLAGPPGAGKGTIQNQLFAEAEQRFTIVDPDEFKVLLIRAAIEDGSIRDMMPSVEETHGLAVAPMELAALVHEESSFLALQVRQDALRRGENVVIDSVMSNQDKALLTAKQLARSGYDIQVVDVEVPEALSRARIAQRWVEQTRNSELGGRWVPSEFRELIYDGPPGTSSRCDVAARAVAEQVREVSRYRRFFTTMEEAEQKAGPRLTDDLRRDNAGRLRKEGAAQTPVSSVVQASYPPAARAGSHRPTPEPRSGTRGWTPRAPGRDNPGRRR